MSDGVQQEVINMAGGFISDLGLFNMPSGSLIACKNYEVVESGYRSCAGYERFDGRQSPSSIKATEEDYAARELQRSLIQPVAGSGAILGVIEFKGVVYAFRNNETGTQAQMWKASDNGWILVNTGVTLAPDGRYRFVVYNFYAQDGGECLYGVDGKNAPFEFDGATFTQLNIGTTSKPTTIAAHNMHLFIGFVSGSIMHSAVGNPVDWDVANGAGEIGIGDEVTDLLPMVGGVLQIGARNRIMLLSGSSSADWVLNGARTQDESAGCLPSSMFKIAGKAYYLTVNGIREISATNTFGDFSIASVSKLIDGYLNELIPSFVDGVVFNGKSQYRLYFLSNGVTDVVTMSIGAAGLLGFSLQRLPFVVSCVKQSVNSMANESLWYGSGDGYVYKAETGTSFDGKPIEASIRTSFSFQGAPTLRKRYKKATLAVTSGAHVLMSAKPMFDYGSNDIAAHEVKQFFGVADIGVWGVDRWGSFVWTTGGSGLIEVDIGGTAQSVSMYFYSKNAFNNPQTINSMIIDYIPRRLVR